MFCTTGDLKSQLQLDEKQFTQVWTPLVGFAGPSVNLEGMITQMVTAGKAPKRRTVPANFVVIKEPSPITCSCTIFTFLHILQWMHFSSLSLGILDIIMIQSSKPTSHVLNLVKAEKVIQSWMSVACTRLPKAWPCPKSHQIFLLNPPIDALPFPNQNIVAVFPTSG